MTTVPPQPVRGVVFDLDGTLTVPALDFAAMRADIGVPEGDILGALDAMPADERTRALAVIEEHEQAAAADSRLSEGARELLDFLAATGVRIGVVTRNSRRSVETFSEKHAIRFDAVVTREDAPPKPSPEPLRLALDRMGVAPREAIYVGDFELDRLTGDAAGIATYIVRNHPEIRDEGPPDMRVDSLRGLIPIIEQAGER